MATKRFFVSAKWGDEPRMSNSNQNIEVWAENSSEASKKVLADKKSYKFVEILSVHTEKKY